MKNIKYIFLAASVAMLASCNFLDIVPDNVPTIDHAFTDRASAEKFLASLYWLQPYYGSPADDPAIGAGDEYAGLNDGNSPASTYGYEKAIQLGMQSVSSPYYDYWSGGNGGRGTFVLIRDCDIFLQRIESVRDLDESTMEAWIGEVKFLKAMAHFYLMRLYGPIPVIREPVEVSAGVQAVRPFRDPVQDVVEYICELCDEAIESLPNTLASPSTDYGHITRPAAAMLKAQALIWLASPLFNGNPDYADFVDKRGKHLFPTEDNSRWARAAQACKEAIDICDEAGIQLFHFVDARYDLSPETNRLMDIRGAMTQPWNEEMIMGHARWHVGLQRHMIPHFGAHQLQAGGGFGDFYPTFKMAELFYSNHGVPIDEDVDYDYDGRYNLTTVGADHYYYIPEGKVTAVLNTYREPRFYADLGFDTGYWWGNGRTADVGKGDESTAIWVLEAKAGEVSGRTSSIRHTRTGYYGKKVINYQTAGTSSGGITVVNSPWPVMRLADLYLLYAEALNESMDAPDDSVYKYINKVRERAGLEGVVESWSKYSKIPGKPSTKEGMRDIIRQERLIELAFEGPRFYDLRRWKLAHTYMNQTDMGWNVNGSTAEDYYTLVVRLQPTFAMKDYLWPITENETLRNLNLVQNPGWE